MCMIDEHKCTVISILLLLNRNNNLINNRSLVKLTNY